jgi:hypothetical protein
MVATLGPETNNTVRLDDLEGGAATSGWSRYAWLVANQYVLPVAIPSAVRGQLESISWCVTTSHHIECSLVAEVFCSCCEVGF